jgi:Domain of unknown function (DUF397)
MAGDAWRKSSASNPSGENCVELAPDDGGVVVRDSKDHSERTLVFSRFSWRTFVAGLK